MEATTTFATLSRDTACHLAVPAVGRPRRALRAPALTLALVGAVLAAVAAGLCDGARTTPPADQAPQPTPLPGLVLVAHGWYGA
jgi:hypothetical protein